MFTGIIKSLGKLSTLNSSKMGKKLSITSTLDVDDLLIGDSVAVNGTCLTITKIKKGCFSADVSPETLNKTTLKWIRVGDLVNLEKALKFSDRLNGHLVSGHIDNVGFLKKKTNLGNAVVMVFSIPKSLSKYMIVKGSIAVDGISLTVNKCDEESFSVSVIPHTLKITALKTKKLGDGVNIETDIVGKYIEQFVRPNYSSVVGNSDSNIKTDNRNNIDIALLAKNRFV